MVNFSSVQFWAEVSGVVSFSTVISSWCFRRSELIYNGSKTKLLQWRYSLHCFQDKASAVVSFSAMVRSWSFRSDDLFCNSSKLMLQEFWASLQWSQDDALALAIFSSWFLRQSFRSCNLSYNSSKLCSGDFPPSRGMFLCGILSTVYIESRRKLPNYYWCRVKVGHTGMFSFQRFQDVPSKSLISKAKFAIQSLAQ